MSIKYNNHIFIEKLAPFKELTFKYYKMIKIANTILPISLLIVATINARAQKPIYGIKRGMIHANCSLGQFITRGDVQQQIGDKKFLTAKNTNSILVGLSYEYTTKLGFTLEPMLSYGRQQTDLVWNFAFKNFDPSSDFGDYSIKYEVNNKVSFITNTVYIGYRFKLPGKGRIHLQPKLGLGNTNRFNYISERKNHLIAYGNPPDANIYIRQYAATDAQSGNERKWYSDLSPFYTIYLGVSKPIENNYLKEVRLGVIYTHSIAKHNGEAFNLSRSFYYNSAGDLIGLETFKNHFQYLGVMLSAGF